MVKIEKSMLGVHLDVGHDSIGWCVTSMNPGTSEYLAIPGCGVVLFPADDCLANQRRDFRRQRRHIRSTRQRIAHMKALLLSMGVMTAEELDRNYTAAPWKLAAEALNWKTLSWIEMWSVLRWYAHNRGYDGETTRGLQRDAYFVHSSIDDDDFFVNSFSVEANSDVYLMFTIITGGLGEEYENPVYGWVELNLSDEPPSKERTETKTAALVMSAAVFVFPTSILMRGFVKGVPFA